MNFYEFYNIRVTGKIVSEDGQPSVERLDAIVATVYEEDHPDYEMFKVWPKDSKDPQLPKNHDGKLWFDRNEADVEIISDEGGNSLPKKIYLDDVRSTPEGWVRTYCAKNTIEHLKSGWVTHLSLDHDLGSENCWECKQDPDTNHGYTVLVWLEEQVISNNFAPPKHIMVHSDNMSARIKMEMAIKVIHKRAKRCVE